MINFPYVKPANIIRVLLLLGCALAVSVQAESNIDKYRSKKKPLFRRYQEKLNMGKTVSPSIKAQKRSLPPGAFKQDGIFKSTIKDSLPENQVPPIAETPYLPQEFEKEKPWINSQRFKADEDTRSRFEPQDEEQTEEESNINILDFDNLSAEILNQNISGSSLLEDGILPDEEALNTDPDAVQRNGFDPNNPDGNDPENNSPFDRMMRDSDTVTPYRPSLSPSLTSINSASDDSSADGRLLDPSIPDSEQGDPERLNPEDNSTFQSSIQDQRLIIGEDPGSESDDEKDGDDNTFSQSQQIIERLTSPHVQSFEAEQKKKLTSNATETLLEKYSFKPADLSYDPQRRRDEATAAQRSNFGDATANQLRNTGRNLQSNSTIGRASSEASTAFRPTSDAQPLGGQTFQSLENATAATSLSGDSYNFGGNADRSNPNDGRFQLGATPSQPRFADPNRLANPTQPGLGSTFRNNAMPSRFEGNYRDQNAASRPSGNTANSQQGARTRSGFDMMRETRERNRVRSSFGNSGYAIPGQR